MVHVKEQVSYDIFRTAWGWVGVAFTPRGLRRLVLPRPGRHEAERELGMLPGAATAAWPELRRGIRDYFAGRGPCQEIPIDCPGGTRFTRRVLRAARAIPPGATMTYGALAARAVGQVMARNPVPLVVPCHRVVASGGAGGYAGGLAMKDRLLALERRSRDLRP